jgi:CO dehydrogenase maturation factor
MTQRRSRTTRPAPFRIAVIGKGGSGKSVISGTLARLLARRGHRVLALDSDPLPGMALSIGIDAGDRAMLEGFAERKADGEWRIVRNLKPATVVRRAAMEGPDGILFLQFGKVLTSSLPPIMSSLQAFWGVTRHLPPAPWTVVHDLPAGTRQAYAGWPGGADVFLVVLEPSHKSLLSARRLAGLQREVTRSKLALVGNKLRSDADVAFVANALPGVEPIALVPFDPAVVEADLEGAAPLDRDPASPAILAMEELAERVESLVGRSSA